MCISDIPHEERGNTVCMRALNGSVTGSRASAVSSGCSGVLNKLLIGSLEVQPGRRKWLLIFIDEACICHSTEGKEPTEKGCVGASVRWSVCVRFISKLERKGSGVNGVISYRTTHRVAPSCSALLANLDLQHYCCLICFSVEANNRDAFVF